MKITKYEHSCLVVEQDGQKLIIDPGVFSTSCKDFSNVSAVVVTHIHPDHFDPDTVAAIAGQNADVMIFTVDDVAKELNPTIPHTCVTAGQHIDKGPFKLDFYGGEHAVIHATYPTAQNKGVMVNDKLYYSGDSFAVPSKPVEVLAVPSAGPWMKVGEAIDFIAALKPKKAFPTHNAILSEIGATIHNRILESGSKSVGAEYIVLQPGQSLSI